MRSDSRGSSKSVARSLVWSRRECGRASESRRPQEESRSPVRPSRSQERRCPQRPFRATNSSQVLRGGRSDASNGVVTLARHGVVTGQAPEKLKPRASSAQAQAQV